MKLLVLINNFAFPHGRASSTRVALIGRALLKKGWSVHVLATKPTETLGKDINKLDKGIFKGVQFTYTCGSRIRSNSFLIRRYQAFRGVLVALLKILAVRRREKCVLYLYSHWPVLCIPATILAKALKIPVVVELCEWRPAKTSKISITNLYYQHIRLQTADGVFAISSFLEKKTRECGKKLSEILKLPILIDAKEYKKTQGNIPSQLDRESMYTLWCGHIGGYIETVKWIIKAFSKVASINPSLSLVVVGKYSPAEKRRIFAETQHCGMDDTRIKLTGYVSREELGVLYKGAIALLAPLEDNARSCARFPTKLGEYLASGRPVITSAVGEINSYFENGENAFIAAPEDVESYAKKIGEVISDPQKATAVGVAGRKLAEKAFHFEEHSDNIDRFLQSLLEKTSYTLHSSTQK